MTEATLEPSVTPLRRVLIVDDRPEIRMLVRARLRMVDDIEVVGEASNGAEALVLVSALAPEAVVLDLEMPVMRGDEAIPKMRELAPGMPIVLYTSAEEQMLDGLSEAAQPDAIVKKGGSLTHLVDQLQALLDMGPHDLLRVVLGRIPLRQAMTVFDAWVGLNVRILDSLSRGDELVLAQLGGATLEELQALIGVYAHLGDNLQKAAREHADDVEPVIHLFRTTAAAARRALLALDEVRLREFYAAWNYEVPADALIALGEMRDRLIEVLPASGAEDIGGGTRTLDNTGSSHSGGDQEPEGRYAAAAAQEASAIDRQAAAIGGAAALDDRAAASIDDVTGTYRRGPGHVELTREIARARGTGQSLALAFVAIDGLKAVNDSRGHAAVDQLPRDVAAEILKQLRDYDVVVRHGGNEFVCVLPGMNMDEAKDRMQRLHMVAPGPDARTIMVGLALLENGDSPDSLIDRARPNARRGAC